MNDRVVENLPGSALVVTTGHSVLKPSEIPNNTKSPLIEGGERLEKLLAADNSFSPTDKRAIKDTITDLHKIHASIKDRVAFLNKKGITDPRALYALCSYGRPEEGIESLDNWIIYGFPIGVTYDLNPAVKEKGKTADLIPHYATPQTMQKILEVLEFVQPGESLTQRVNRIKGKPGTTFTTHVFDETTGANIAFDPKKINDPSFEATAWLDSPLMQPYTLLRTTVDMTKQGETLSIPSNTLKETRLMFTAPEGATEHQYQTSIGQILFNYGR